MSRVLFAIVISLLTMAVKASVIGEFKRSDNVDTKYPETIIVNRFSQAQVDNMACETDSKREMILKTDKGNFTVGSVPLLYTNVVEINCEGKPTFYVVDIETKYHSGKVLEGDVAVWFGEYKERYGCEGYKGCDKVYILHTYHSSENLGDLTGAGVGSNVESW